MSRIVFCWELGAGAGHIHGFLPVARELSRRGHEVIFVIKDLTLAEPAIGDCGFRYLQAPVFGPTPATPAVSCADILLNNGFGDPDVLLGRCRAWLAIFRGLCPDLIIANHSPSALVAGRATDFCVATFGTGFFSPPPVSPSPSLRPWMDVPAARLEALDARARCVVNTALERLEAKPLAALHELFDVSEDFLCSFAELDPYPGRGAARYWGPRFNIHGVPPDWPAAGGAEVFAYLNTGYPHLEALLAVLGMLPHRTLVYFAGAMTDRIRRFETQRLRVSLEPCNLQRVAAEADLYIGHGGFGASCAMLLGGCPQLVLPFQLEQFLNGRNIVALGAGACAVSEDETPAFAKLIDTVLSGATYRESAKAFAARYAEFDVDASVAEIADRCDALVSIARAQ